MKGLSVLFTILLFLLAGKLAQQLRRAGTLPEEGHGQTEAMNGNPPIGLANARTTYAHYPFKAQQKYD